MLLLALLAIGSPGRLAAQEHAAPAAAGEAAGQPPHDTPSRPAEAAAMADEHAEEAHEEPHGESPWALVGRIFNFVLLAGTIVYLARKPIGEYMTRRRTEVRADLEMAERMKQAAATHMAEMDERLAALPAELEALKARGQQEIAAEEARIRALAESERARLLEHARREIDQRVRLARRELIEHAATLAVGLAEVKVKQQITDDDQSRLVDRYLAQVRSHD
ncbi:MAG TPA: ATP synthase F0 subunit B [Methylomirabilota bacterium]